MTVHLQPDGIRDGGSAEPKRRLSTGVAAAIGAAAILGGTALAVARRARRAEAEHPPVGRFLDVDGVRLHYLERGFGTPLVLLHGNGSLIEDFLASGLVDDLAIRFRVLAFDRPGFGYSERPRATLWTPSAQAALIGAALHRLGARRAVVLGHSWGTLVALALAESDPVLVKSLVLVSGYYYPTARADVPLLSGPALPIIGDVLRYIASPLIARFLWPRLVERLFAPAPVAPSFADMPRELILRPSQIRASAEDTALMIAGASELSSGYRHIEIPALILAGEGDRLVNPRAHSERLAGDLRYGRLTLVPEIGHMLPHSRPDLVRDAVDQASRTM